MDYGQPVLSWYKEQPCPRRQEWIMRALETLLIYLIPFLAVSLAVRLLMKRRSVDLTDVQSQAGAHRRPRRVFLLGGWRSEA
jgi:hypothetical protein